MRNDENAEFWKKCIFVDRVVEALFHLFFISPKAMLEDKLKATDWETTDETMTEIVARESYLQWLKENQRKHRSQVWFIKQVLSCLYFYTRITYDYLLVCLS